MVRASVNISHVFLSVLSTTCSRRRLRNNRSHIMLHLPTILTPIGTYIVPLIGGSNLPRGTHRVLGRLGFSFHYSCSRGSSVKGQCHHRSTMNAPFSVAISRRALRSGYMAVHRQSSVRRRHIPISGLRKVVDSTISVHGLFGGVTGWVW